MLIEEWVVAHYINPEDIGKLITIFERMKKIMMDYKGGDKA